MVESPAALFELSIVRPEICPSCCSSGVVTSVATVVALAPGYCVVTTRLGASISGSADTGSALYPMMPSSNTAAINSEVAIGRRMKMEEKLIEAGGREQGAGKSGGHASGSGAPAARRVGKRQGMWRERGTPCSLLPRPCSLFSSMPPAPAALLRSGLEFGRGRWRWDLARLHGEHLGALLQAELAGGHHEIAGLEALGDD